MTIEIENSEVVYEGWLTVRKATMRDDAGERFSRLIEDHGEGVAVLPYDPTRKVALVVRLPRAPVLFKGETEHLIEAPAGLLEQGEEPAAAARREALEEAGVALTTMEPLGTIWTMPGVSTERMHLFLAPYALADRVAGGRRASPTRTRTSRLRRFLSPTSPV